MKKNYKIKYEMDGIIITEYVSYENVLDIIKDYDSETLTILKITQIQ